MQILYISLIFLSILFKTQLIWYMYTLFIPGYCILSYFGLDKKESSIFALPFSLLFIHWPYFLITRSGIGLPSIYFTIVPLIPIILYLSRQPDLKLSMPKIPTTIKKGTLNTILISSILFGIMFYSFEAFISPGTFEPFNNGMSPGVPRTLGARYIAETQLLKENILDGTGAIGWSDDWFSGMHTFTSYSPLSYMILAVNGLRSELWSVHNTNVFLFSFLYAIYLYYLLRHLKISKCISLTVSFLSATLPAFIQVNNVFKTSVDMALQPLLFLSLIMLLEKPDIKNSIIFATITSLFVLNYYLTMYIILIPMAVFVAYYIYDSPNKKDMLLTIIKSGILAFAIGGIWTIPFLHGSLTKDFSMMSYTEGDWHSPMESLDNVLEFLAKPIDSDNITFELSSFTTLTPAFFWLGLISSIIIFLYSLRSKNCNYRVSIISLSLLAFLLIQLTPVRELIPFYYSVYGKIYIYFPLIPFFAISIAQLVESQKSRSRYIIPISIALLIIISIPSFRYAHNLGSFLSEGSVVREENLEWLSNPLEYLGNGGSFVVFNLYGPGYIPGITMYKDIQAFSGYGHECHATLQSYEKRIVPFQEATMDNLLTDNPYYAYNIFKQSNVRVLAMQRCSMTSDGKSTIIPDSNENKAYATLTKDPRFNIVSNESCIALLTTTDPKKAEKILLTEILVENPEEDQSEKIKYATTHNHLPEMLNNREKAINSVLSVSTGENLHFTKDEFAFGKENYANIIINRTATKEEIEAYLKNNSTVIYFGKNTDINNPNFLSYDRYPNTTEELDMILSELRYIDTQINFEENTHDYEFNEKGFILIKETYFRKWHSNADLKESYLGFMLIKADGQTKTWFAPTYIDYTGSIMTILSLLMITNIIYNRKKYNKKNDDHENRKPEKKRKANQKSGQKKR